MHTCIAYIPLQHAHVLPNINQGKPKKKSYNETDYEHTFSHRAITVIYGIRSLSRKNHVVMDDELTNNRNGSGDKLKIKIACV